MGTGVRFRFRKEIFFRCARPHKGFCLGVRLGVSQSRLAPRREENDAQWKKGTISDWKPAVLLNRAFLQSLRG